ncbi:hypothetical protein KKI24_28635 [bacterium]|nr:hypothetical protein [bacterium]
MKVDSLKLVSRFTENKNIILSCGKELQVLEKQFNGHLIKLQVPENAPPEISRIIIHGSNFALGMGYNQFELTVRPPKQIFNNFNDCMDFGFERVKSVLDTVSESIPDHEWLGVVSILNFPMPDADNGMAAAVPIFDHLLTVNRKKRELASFQVQFGYRESGKNILYTISGYDEHEIMISVNADFKKNAVLQKKAEINKPVLIDLAQHPITETGIRVIIDINNKPSENSGKMIDDFYAILENQKEVYLKLPQEVNLDGVLQ